MNEEEKVPFTAHLEELRTRLIRCFIAIGIGCAVSFCFKKDIFDILALPLIDALNIDQGDKIIYTGPPEAFLTYLKVALLTGIMLAVPVILYEFWMFVSPGLYKKEKKVLLPIIFLSSFFFLGGAFLGYFYIFPFIFDFFLSFASDTIVPRITMKEYLSFSAKLLFAFGIVFELPLVITFMTRMGLVTIPFLKKNRKYAILLSFIGAAMITPPDPLTMFLMAIPLVVLYEISILGAIIFGKPRPEQDELVSE